MIISKNGRLDKIIRGEENKNKHLIIWYCWHLCNINNRIVKNMIGLKAD